MARAILWCIHVTQSGRQERSLLCDASLHFSMHCNGGLHVSAAAHVAALDGDGLGHVHTKQRAEGLRLRGAHAGHSSGLDPVSTGY